jgi:Tfp pilus tip-associated adhesin PilY1
MDPLTVTSSPNTIAIYPNPRSSSTQFVNQALTLGVCTQAEFNAKLCLLQDPYTLPIPNQPQPVVTQAYPPQSVNYTTQGGWYVDLIQSGETANTDPILALGTLSVNTNIPSANACQGGGSSYNYEFDYCTGGAVLGETSTDSNGVTTGTVAVFLGNGLATSSVVQQLGGGAAATAASVTTPGSSGPTDTGTSGSASFICRLSTGVSCSRSLIPNLPLTLARRTSWREIPAP